jgi:hypothetical protein
MSENEGTLETLARHLVLAISPLKDAVSSPEEFKAFMYRLGWDPTSLPPSYTAIGNAVDDAVQALEILSDDPTLAEVFDLIAKAKSVYDGVHGITEAPTGVDAGEFLADIGERIFELLLTDYLASALPAVHHALKILNVIQSEILPETPTRHAHVRTRIQWDQIPKILGDPVSLPKIVYGWGTPQLKLGLIADHLAHLIHAAGLPVIISPDSDGLRNAYNGTSGLSPEETYIVKVPFCYAEIAGLPVEMSFVVFGIPGAEGRLPGIVIQPQIPSSFPATFHLADTIDLRIRAGSDIASLFGVVIRPDSISVKYPFQSGTTLPTAGFGVGFDFKPETTAILLGKPGETRVQLKDASIDFGINYSNAEIEVLLSVELRGFALIVAAGQGDGFLSKLLGDSEVNVELPVGIDWSSESGLKFRGGGGFEVALHPHLTLGPIAIEELDIRLTGSTTPPPKVQLDLGVNVKGTLGPVVCVVQGVGVSLASIFESGGNAGPFDIDVGFMPPKGVGLSVDTGLIKGGGFLRLDPEKGEYVGALELDFQGIFSLKAVGIINTKMPDGSRGFSLLIIITAEFTPIQLGFGFTLVGVGGLLGLNRTTLIDVLREGIKTNAIKSVLFPEDIVANIDRIVSDIRQIFPPMEGRFIIGPMAKIAWGTPSLITLELGLLLEIPVPRIAILGVLKALLPEEDAPLLILQVNFLGVFDLDNKYISFDATLYESRLLAFTLTGDMAFRFSWGENRVLVLSVGGFHPAFRDAPADLQNLARLSISLLSGENPRISAECYFAVTSNTLQFGAKAELYAAACGFNVYGFVGYDVLIQRKPFHFDAAYAAGLALREGTNVIMGIKVSGELSGPTPWDVRGEGSISILFFSITVGFHETWGDPIGAIVDELEDLLALLTGEINDVRNWKADIPDKSTLHVSIKTIESPPDMIIIHPFGVLSLSQRLLPLGITIERFGTKLPLNANRFDLTEPMSNGTALPTIEAKEQFARANFFNMSDKDKLSNPSFEGMLSGFSVDASSGLTMATAVNKNVEYELTYLRKKKSTSVAGGVYAWSKGLFKSAVKGGAAGNSPLSYGGKRMSRNAPDAVAVSSDTYVITDVDTMERHSPEMVAASYSEAAAMLQEVLRTHPEMKGRLQILTDYELSGN